MDLETCKRRLIAELAAHEKEELKKSCSFQIDRIISKGQGFAVGTVRGWNGQKHRKVAPGKWVPVYDSKDDRAARQPAAHVARQIKGAKDFKELGARKSCAERINELKKAMFAAMGGTA